MQAPTLAADQGAWVVLDCYILGFIYWLFAAYEQEREYNEMMLHKSLDKRDLPCRPSRCSLAMCPMVGCFIYA
ncbi:hypothetical protein BC937DRAFT_94179 [Endogone sp. FLAS-F59071]|nr:hypothetical protein BC937DRAFT_94179 [Endogone sp. FLAS-F59071]|eukprot:RUS14210.1 hypothetical protein BC937DRAFT_94179 [Endogone sp. FLAS-F59071]